MCFHTSCCWIEPQAQTLRSVAICSFCGLVLHFGCFALLNLVVFFAGFLPFVCKQDDYVATSWCLRGVLLQCALGFKRLLCEDLAFFKIWS